MSEPTPPLTGINLLPDGPLLTQEEIADMCEPVLLESLPVAGDGLNNELIEAANYARRKGVTDVHVLTDLIDRVCVGLGRTPEEAKTEATRAARRAMAGSSAVTVPAAPKVDIKAAVRAGTHAAAKAILPPSRLLPQDPHEQLRVVLKAFYGPGERLVFSPSVDQGVTLTVEEVMRGALPQADGQGMWWRANPVGRCTGAGGTAADQDIKAFKFMLAESDHLPIEAQVKALHAVGLEVAFAVTSGGKSVHSYIRLHGVKTVEQYKALTRPILHALARLGFDYRTSNPARACRPPGFTRENTGGTQELVYLNPTAASLTAEDVEPVRHRVDKLVGESTPHSRISSIDSITYDVLKAAPEIVEGLLTANSFAVMYGPPGCGKSFIAMDVSVHVAMGSVWRDPIDRRRTVQGPVLYIALEGKEGATKRIHALKARYNVPAGTPWYLSTMRMDLQTTECVKEIGQAVAEVKALCGRAPVLIVIDTLARAIGGNENDFEVMSKAVSHLGQVQDWCEACVWTVHHTGKDTTKGARGHSSLIAAADTMIEVGKEDGTITAVMTKQKDDGPCADLVFRLEQVVVGPGQYEDRPATTCVLEHLPASEGSGVAGKSAERREEDMARYEEWLALLPQGSLRGWAAAAEVGEATMRKALKRLSGRGVCHHGKDSSGSIVRVARGLEMLPEVGE